MVGVFKPEKWLFANDKEFADFPKADPKRIGFIGNVADSEILLEYLNKDIPLNIDLKEQVILYDI